VPEGRCEVKRAFVATMLVAAVATAAAPVSPRPNAALGAAIGGAAGAGGGFLYGRGVEEGQRR
jgi:hypothetical protein